MTLVSELTIPQLNEWVAKANGIEFTVGSYYGEKVIYVGEQVYSPSTDWSQGGPIIERKNFIQGSSIRAISSESRIVEVVQ